jgi:hypothetical protein
MGTSDLKLLKNKEDFAYYILAFDQQCRYPHLSLKQKSDNKLMFRHYGIPNKYPCLATSTFCDNPNGQDEIWHEFYYYEDVVGLIEAVATNEAESEFLKTSEGQETGSK